jgi:molecular chaperone GrpE
MDNNETIKENLNQEKAEDQVNSENEKNESPENIIKELEDKVARNLAEMENQRRRFEKERDEAFEYGGFSFAKEALNLVDNLERAKISLENDEEIKNSPLKKKILDHMEIIYNDTLSILKKNNIQQIETINKKMDPNIHQAMMEIEDDSKPQGTIVQEIQKGYLMKERLLRPSLVGVSKKSKIEEKINNQEKNEQNNEKMAKK